MFKNFLIYIGFAILACLIAGMFGIVHDQVTYSISPEYYTCFKFNQFQISEFLRTPARLGVSFVGFFATWWTGLIIGGVIGLIGINKNNYPSLFKLKLKSLVAVLLVTVCFSVIGYIVGVVQTSGMKDWAMNVGGKPLGNHTFYELDKITDFVSFYQVGMIHNFSYVGGLIGLVVGVIYHFKKLKKITQN